MKKSVVIAVLGLAAGVATSYGQGTISFNTYAANSSSGILTTLANGTTPVANGAFTGELLYSLTPIVDSIGTAVSVQNPLTAGWSFGPTALSSNNGYFTSGSNLVLGSGATTYFEIIAFNGASYASSTIRGHSASFSQSLATGLTVPWPADGNPAVGGGSGLYAAFSVYSVPEPTTLALAGLGGLSLLMLRRKQS